MMPAARLEISNVDPGAPLRIDWTNTSTIDSRSYVCGYCDHRVGPNAGYYATLHRGPSDAGLLKIYLCSHCQQPTYFDLADAQYPGVPFGNDVQHVPPEVGTLYEEARRAYSVRAFTASVLACRKILMNVAVAQGDDEGKTFAEYVTYLADNNYIPPGSKPWVDRIRKKGNLATHEIALMTAEDAEELISFAEMLLKVIYEFPARAGV